MSDNEQVKHTAKLARLAISDGELPVIVDNFNRILDFFKIIDEVDTEDLPEYSHYPDEDQHLRKDQTVHALTTEQALSNAPDRQDNMFKTPLIVSAE